MLALQDCFQWGKWGFMLASGYLTANLGMRHMLGLELYDHSQGWMSAIYVDPDAIYRPRISNVPTATMVSVPTTTPEPSYPTPWVWSIEFLESSGFNISESMPAILEVTQVEGIEYVKESRTFAAPLPPSQPTSPPPPREKPQKAFEKILEFCLAVFLYLFDQLNLLNWYLIRQTPLHSIYLVVLHLRERNYQRAKRILLVEFVSMEEALISSKAELEGNYTSLGQIYILQQGENQDLQARVLELEAENVNLSKENKTLHLDVHLRDEQIIEISQAHRQEMEEMERKKDVELDTMSEKIQIHVARIEGLVSQQEQSDRDKTLAKEKFDAEIERLNNALSEKDKNLNQIEQEKAAMAMDLSRQIEQLAKAKKTAQEHSVAEINRLQEAIDRGTDALIKKDQALHTVVLEKEALTSDLARHTAQSEREKKAAKEQAIAEAARFQRLLDEKNTAISHLIQEKESLTTDALTLKSDNTRLAEEKETQAKIDKGLIERLEKELGEAQPSSIKEAEDKGVQQQQSSPSKRQPKPEQELLHQPSSLNAAAAEFAPSPRPKRPVPPLLPCHQAYQASIKLNPSHSELAPAIRQIRPPPPPPCLVQPSLLGNMNPQSSWVLQNKNPLQNQSPMRGGQDPNLSPTMHWAPPTEPRAMRERRLERLRGFSPQKPQMEMQPRPQQQFSMQKIPPTEPRAMRERRRQERPELQGISSSLQAQAIIIQPQQPQTPTSPSPSPPNNMSSANNTHTTPQHHP